MARYRLVLTSEQEAVLRMHCAQPRFVWNLAVEQQSWWKLGRKSAPGYLEQCRQLTEARREFGWLRNGSQTVQQQALRGTGEVVGVDRGVAVNAALSSGELLHVPRMSPGRQRRLVLLQRRLARAKRGSSRRKALRLSIARLKARDADGRKDWAEKLSTDLAWRFDVIRVEDLRIRNMTRSARGTVAAPGRNVGQKAGLNREIARSGWGLLVSRLEDKAPGRVEKVNPAFTSQRCSACGHVASESRESQSRFRCVACGFAANADVNAALNIAAGHAVNARGADRAAGAMKREPQAASRPGIPAVHGGGGCQEKALTSAPVCATWQAAS